MPSADKAPAAAGQPCADLVIAGAGVMGLWAAFHAGRRGLRTLLLDTAHAGAGASGGLLGALMPHMPDRWSAKKQFQFDALVSLEERIAELEAMTGLSAGYRRCGRLIPLPKPHLREIALRHSVDAQTVWHGGERRFHWHVTDAPPVDGWLRPDAGASGFVQDTLAGRVFPRALVAALKAAIASMPEVTIRERAGVAGIDAERKALVMANGESLPYGACIVAAGVASFPLLETLGPALARPLGQPVKGQAALLQANADPAMPVIYLDGLYVVAHEGGHVAVGSTSENRFDEPFTTDAQLDDLIGRARDLVPALRDAPVAERWAGLRPKAVDRDPMVGPHPDHPSVIALTGGFKVSFGLAHELAAAAIRQVAGEAGGLPDGFALAHHLAVASRF